MTNNCEIVGDVAYIVIRRRDGTVVRTVIDADDLWLAQSVESPWRVNRQPGYGFYVVSGNGSKGRPMIHLHRLIMNAPDGFDVDHVNHDTLDNRKTNLRIVSRSQNLRHRKGANKNSSSGTRGVNRYADGWRVSFMREGRTYYFGLYKDLDQAKEVAERALAELAER